VMTCEEASVLLHPFMDDELGAGQAHQIEAHLASCPRCTAQLARYRELHRAITALALQYRMPSGLWHRIEAALSAPPQCTSPTAETC
jgi:anti-sigma factor RsiW